MPGAEIINTAASDGSALDVDSPVTLYLSGGIIRGYYGLDLSQGPFSIVADGDTIIFTNKPADGHALVSAYCAPDPKFIFFVGNDGRVYGDVTLTQTLTIPAGTTLTIPAGTSLNNQGKIINDGTIVGRDRLTGGAVEESNSSGGGCDAGIAGFASIASLAFIALRRKKR
jgi:Synergist-CTERM protein sorting domain-containing protein